MDRLTATAEILPAARVETIQSGYRRLDWLRAETERLHAEMLALCAAEQRKGEEAGRRAGAAEGLKLLDQVEQAVVELIASLEGELGLLALAIAERIIGQFDEHEQIGRAIDQAIRDLRDGEAATLHVAPKYLADIRGRLTSLHGMIPVAVEADMALGDADCVLETTRGTIDAGIRRQLDVLRQALCERVGHAGARRQDERGDQHDVDL